MKAVKFLSVLCLNFFLCVAAAGDVFGQETEKKAATLGTPDIIPATDKPNKEGDQPSNEDPRQLNSVNNTQTNKERYRIGFQDTVEVQVFRHPELSQVVNVNPDGTISMPRIDKPIQAVCKTERELADAIAALYKENYLRNPFVNVRAVEQKSQSFAVIGAVEKPGSFYVNRRIRLLELLAFAGGPNEEAGTHLIVARTGSNSVCRSDDGSLANEDADIEVINYKLKDVKEAKVNLWMKPGDIVSVLDADIVYVVGNVNKAKTIQLKSPITLRQAIADAEGLKPAAKKSNIRIIRQKENGQEPEELVFNLKEIEEGKAKDPILQPNDIVAVSEDKTKSILNAIGKSLTQGLPSTVPFLIP